MKTLITSILIAGTVLGQVTPREVPASTVRGPTNRVSATLTNALSVLTNRPDASTTWSDIIRRTQLIAEVRLAFEPSPDADSYLIFGKGALTTNEWVQLPAVFERRSGSAKVNAALVTIDLSEDWQLQHVAMSPAGTPSDPSPMITVPMMRKPAAPGALVHMTSTEIIDDSASAALRRARQEPVRVPAPVPPPLP